jgi:hypothetical protein
MGHAVNKVLKDMIVKTRQLMGFDAQYAPGWDCHGLPIENAIEKKHGRNLSRDEMQAKSRAYATEQIGQQMVDFKRLGVLGDWEHPYRTMDFANEAGEIRAFKRVIERGFVYRGPEARLLVLRLRLLARRVRDRVRGQEELRGRTSRSSAPSRRSSPRPSGLGRPLEGCLRRDLDDHAVDDPREPGAEPQPRAALQPRSTPTAACCWWRRRSSRSASRASGCKAPWSARRRASRSTG